MKLRRRPNALVSVLFAAVDVASVTGCANNATSAQYTITDLGQPTKCNIAVGVDIYNYGTVAPGTSIGTLTITNGPYRQGPAGKLEIELASASSYDRLLFPDGGAFLEGGSLELTLVDGYIPAAGTNFDLMDWHEFGSITGTFSTLNLPSLPASRTWDTSQLYTMGVISVIGPPAVAGDFDGNGSVGPEHYETWKAAFGSTTELAGDGNGDGVVNAADYIVWRNHMGSGTSLANDSTAGKGQDDYNRWRSSFGQAIGRTSIDPRPVSIPEPESGVLLLISFT